MAAASRASCDRFTLSVLMYVIKPASYKRCAIFIVLLTEKYNFLAASCWRVDVVKGGAGDFLAGFLSNADTEKSAFLLSSKNALASCSVSNGFDKRALKGWSLAVVKEASILKLAEGSNSCISRSLSTINRTETD